MKKKVMEAFLATSFVALAVQGFANTVAYYDFESGDSSGTFYSVPDRSGHGFDLARGHIYHTLYKTNDVASFNDTSMNSGHIPNSGSYYSVSTNAFAVGANESLTAEGFLKVDSSVVPDASLQMIPLCTYSSGSSTWSIRLNRSDSSSTNWSVRFWFDGHYVESSTVVGSDTWFYFAGVRNATNDTLGLYVMTGPGTPSFDTVSVPSNAATTDNILKMGFQYWANNSDAYYGFIDDIRISGDPSPTIPGMLRQANYVCGWAPINLGGTWQDVAIDPHKPNIWYAGGDIGGFYKSEDEGNSWRMIDAGLEAYPDIRAAGIAPHPLRAGVVYGCSGRYGQGGLYVSENWGEDWSLLSRDVVFESGAQYGETLAFSHSDPDTFWAAAHDGLYATHDGGETWLKQAFDGRTVRGVQIHPSDDNTVLAWLMSDGGGSGGLYISTNAGAAWSRLATNLDDVLTAQFSPDQPSVILVAANGDGLWRSTDGGATFQQKDSGRAVSDVDFSLVTSGLAYASIASANPVQLLVSTDYGVSWTARTNRIGSTPVLTVKAAVNSPDRVISTDWNWMRISDDEGVAFDLLPVGQEMAAGTSVAFGNSSEIFFGVYDFGSRLSNDGGKSWQHSSPSPGTITNGSAGWYVVGNAFATDTRVSPTVVYHAAGGAADAVFKSYDGGHTWGFLRRNGANIEGNYIATHPANLDRILVRLSAGGWIISSDGGSSWADITGSWDMIKGTPGQAGTLIAVDADGKLYKSVDLGQSWSVLYQDVPVGSRFAINPNNGDEMMVATDLDILRSTDGGQSWNRIGESLEADSFLAFGYYGQLFVGKGWSPAGLGLVARKLFDIRVSSDGGATWNTLMGCPFVGYEGFDNHSIYRGETAKVQDVFDGGSCQIQGIFPDPYTPGRIFIPSSGNTLFVADLLSPKGVPIEWLVSYGLTNRPAAEEELLDRDGDGVVTWEEWVCDTDPTNGNSVLKVTDLTANGSGAQVCWEGGVQATQVLERRTNLVFGTDWVPLLTNVPPTSLTNSYNDSAATNREGFYRFKVWR